MKNRIDIKKHLSERATLPKNGIMNAPDKFQTQMIEMAKMAIKNLPKKYKYIIALVSYLILAGIAGTIYSIIQLINLFI